MNDYSIPHDTITIELTQGYTATIDAIDGDLAVFNWCTIQPRYTPYAIRAVIGDNKKKIYMHREVLSRMVGRPLKRGELTDHIDGDGLNNTRNNLRIATVSQNTRNSRMRSDNTSGFKGVCKERNRWLAQIGVNGKQMRLGLYDTPEEAHAAYCAASEQYHGKYGRTE